VDTVDEKAPIPPLPVRVTFDAGQASPQTFEGKLTNSDSNGFIVVHLATGKIRYIPQSRVYFFDTV
jgi:hypothetical protein